MALEERVTCVGTAGGAGASFDESPHLYNDEDTALALVAREDLHRAAEIAMSDEVKALAQAPESLFQENLTPEGDMWLFRDAETLEVRGLPEAVHRDRGHRVRALKGSAHQMVARRSPAWIFQEGHVQPPAAPHVGRDL